MSPINPENIDIIGKRRDGGLDLAIVPSAGLDKSPETQTLLLEKVALYLDFLHSQECEEEFGELNPAQRRIILLCRHKPDPVMFELFPRVTIWVEDSGATLRFVTNGRTDRQ